jgi:hypothetical protein
MTRMVEQGLPHEAELQIPHVLAQPSMQRVIVKRGAAVGLALFVAACSAPHNESGTGAYRPSLIFDTDIGSDCDDAGAMAVLHRLADKGRINIFGVIFSSGRNRYGAGVCDAINTYYGRDELPLGQYKDDDVGDPRNAFSRQIATATGTYGHHVTDSAADLFETYFAGTARRQRDDRDGGAPARIGSPHARPGRAALDRAESRALRFHGLLRRTTHQGLEPWP